MTLLWWINVACYVVGCLCIPEAWYRGTTRRFWVLFAMWTLGLVGFFALPEIAHSAERTYTFTIPTTGARERCEQTGAPLYTIDSVRVLRYRRQAHPFASAPWIAIQQQRPAIMFQAGCRGGDHLAVTVTKADTVGWVDEITVHNWVTTLDGRVFGVWGDACGATVRAW